MLVLAIFCLQLTGFPLVSAGSCTTLLVSVIAGISAAVLPCLIITPEMDTSNPAVFVNAELLRLYVGRRVRAVIQVLRSDGGVVMGKSTDENQIVVKGSPPAPLSTFVEVVGIADSEKSIIVEVWSNFGDSFDTYTYNQLCQLANGEFKHLFL